MNFANQLFLTDSGLLIYVLLYCTSLLNSLKYFICDDFFFIEKNPIEFSRCLQKEDILLITFQKKKNRST